jgi:hypothetical protein
VLFFLVGLAALGWSQTSLRPLRPITVAAVIMGLLVGINFWAWTALWAVWGGALALALLQALVGRGSRAAVFTLVYVGLLALLAAAPFLAHMVGIQGHPAYADTAFRMGPIAWRLPESWVWSGLLAIVAAGTIVQWWRQGWPVSDSLLVALVLASVVILNQQVVHGILYMFRSHYATVLTVAATAALLYSWTRRQWRAASLITAVCALGVLLLTLSDNRFVLAQWHRDDVDFAQQYLSEAVTVLRGLSPAVVLSDPETSSVVAAFTPHHVLYTHYLQISLVSNSEIAQRLCVTLLPISEEERRLEEQGILVYGNIVNIQLDSAEEERLRSEDLAMVRSACVRMEREDPADVLDRFGVRYVLWNERAEPAWDLAKLGVPLTLQARGAGWSLWQRTGGS